MGHVPPGGPSGTAGRDGGLSRRPARAHGPEAGRPAPAGTAGGGRDGDVVTPEGSGPRATRTYDDPPQTGASLEPCRAIPRPSRLGSGLGQPGPMLRPPLRRPRLPSPRTVADAAV